MSVKVHGYKPGSRGAEAIAEALGAKVLKHEGSRYRPRAADIIINWGSSADLSHLQPASIINDPISVEVASNKLAFFKQLKAYDICNYPEFWENKNDIPEDAYPVVCRTILNGHSGRGIVIADTPDELVDAPLYTRYVKKKDEYRVHVGRQYDENEGGNIHVISLQRKAIRAGQEPDHINHRIRNLDNGYVFVRNDINPPQAVINQALGALESSGLDFGAVDVIWNDHHQKAYVLEINTAPGLEGQTVEDYKAFFEEFVL